jgi:hypothetical protein
MLVLSLALGSVRLRKPGTKHGEASFPAPDEAGSRVVNHCVLYRGSQPAARPEVTRGIHVSSGARK